MLSRPAQIVNLLQNATSGFQFFQNAASFMNSKTFEQLSGLMKYGMIVRNSLAHE